MPLPIRSILFASDLTEASDDVLRAAAGIADLTSAELHVVHVEEPASGYLPSGGESVLDMQRRIHEARIQLVEQLQRSEVAHEVKSARMVSGPAHDAIRERAREVGADLIVLGPNRGPTIGNRFLGTTADRLIRTSDIPCLIVRNPVALPLRQVLVPTDLSEPAQLALEEALSWAVALGVPPSGESSGTAVLVAHVGPPPAAFDPTGREQVASDLRDQVRSARSRVPDSSALDVREMILQHSSPSAEILRLAGSDVDLLVMGTHGRGAFARALVGSVSSVVARQAECPVLLVPPALDRVERSSGLEAAAARGSEDILPRGPEAGR